MDKVILAAIPMFFGLMAIEMLLSWKLKKGFYELKDSVTNLGSGILNQMNSLLAKPFALFVYIGVYNAWNLDSALNLNYFTTDASTPNGVVTWIVGFLLTDFLFYWSHRHSHEINLMWATHIAHHSSEEYNLSVALRQPAFGFLVTTHYVIPSALLGIPPEVYFVSISINLVYQFWIHTRFVKSLGPVLEWILSTPSHHRVHHARQEKYLDKNYAGIFIIWDRMFGTFKKEEEEPIYGVYPRCTKFNAVSINVDPWNELFMYFGKAQGLSNKLKVLFKGPLYIYENFKKGHIPKGMRPPKEKKAAWYVLPTFFISLGFALFALFKAPVMQIYLTGIVFLIVWVMTYIIGYVQDNKSV